MQAAVKKYKVVLEGSKLDGNLAAARQDSGFFTTRFIDAENGEAAAELAVEDLKGEIVKQLNLQGDETARLLIYVAGVAQVDDECFREGRISKEAELHWFEEAVVPAPSLVRFLGTLFRRMRGFWGGRRMAKDRNEKFAK
jgi:hypothetical protein